MYIMKLNNYEAELANMILILMNVIIAPHWVLWLVYMHDVRGCIAPEGQSACMPPEHDNEVCYDWLIAKKHLALGYKTPHYRAYRRSVLQ